MAKKPLKAKDAGAKADANADDIVGPSPNPHTNLLIADLALRGGAMLVRQGLERSLLGRKYAPKKAAQILKSRTLAETLLHSALAKVATKSVPGAIVVGGGLLAKTLYDRRHRKAAQAVGEAKLEERAQDAGGDQADPDAKADVIG